MAFSAGEPSGDRLAAGVLKALKALAPEGVDAYGIGGSALASEGCRLLHDPTSHAAVGLVEQLPALWPAWKAGALLKAQMHRHPPDLLYLVDFQGLNLKLASWGKKRGLTVLYDTPPQDWIWSLHPQGCGRLKGKVDLVLARFLPEFKAYEAADVPVAFVGHPVADLPVAAFRPAVAQEAAELLLLPGSRRAEVARLAKPMAQAAKQVVDEGRAARVRAVAAHGGLVLALESAMRPLLGDRLQVQVGRMGEAMQLADAALVASGTASLEAAMHGLPCALTYRVHPWTAWLAARILSSAPKQGHESVASQGRAQPLIGLPNLLWQRARMPELLQHDGHPEAMAQALRKALDDASFRADVARWPQDLRSAVGRPGSQQRAALQALALLKQKAKP